MVSRVNDYYIIGNMVVFKMKIQEELINLVKILLLLFALFVLYQLIKFIFGGSWEKEDLIIGLLMFNIGLTISIGLSHFGLKASHKYLAGQFTSLANDFKDLSKDFRKLDSDFRSLTGDFKTLTHEFRIHLKDSN